MARQIHLPIDATREIRIEVSKGVNPRRLTVPMVSPSTLSNGPMDFRLVDLAQIDGNTTLEEQILILALAKRQRARKAFEFGTFDGKTCANFAANMGDQAEIVTIDLPAAQVENARLPIGKNDLAYLYKYKDSERWAKLDGFANVVQLYGDTAQFDFSPWYGTRDMVFVDACHEYEYVRNDTEIALRLLQSHGLVIWHDYGAWVGVTRALNEFHMRDPRFHGLRHIAGTTICFLQVMASGVDADSKLSRSAEEIWAVRDGRDGITPSE